MIELYNFTGIHDTFLEFWSTNPAYLDKVNDYF